MDQNFVLYVKTSAQNGKFSVMIMKKWSLWAISRKLPKTEYFLICHFGKSLRWLDSLLPLHYMWTTPQYLSGEDPMLQSELLSSTRIKTTSPRMKKQRQVKINPAYPNCSYKYWPNVDPPAGVKFKMAVKIPNLMVRFSSLEIRATQAKTPVSIK